MAQLDESSLNPFTTSLRKAEDVAAKLAAQKKTVDQELQWFHATNRNALSDQLQAANNLVNALKVELESKDADLAARQRELDDVSSSIRTLFNPKNWFASDQREYRRCRNNLLAILREIESAKGHLVTRMEAAQNEIQATSATIARYDSFDLAARQRVEADLKRQLASARAKCDRLQARKSAVDQALEPAVSQMRDIETRKQQAIRIRNRARDLDSELSSANNSYERAMVHEQCEREFDTGSPRRIIGQKDRDIKRLERDYEKAKKRALEIAERATRTINTIVIDGNNLCYDNDRFIGVSALEAIIPLLDPEYSLIVVFDASIRRMLKTNDGGIKRRFPDQTQVHVVATSNKADETVLDLAEHDGTTYILSNDRFGEFNDKKAVRENRVIRHEIVDGRIFVHDLGINTTYNANDG